MFCGFRPTAVLLARSTDAPGDKPRICVKFRVASGNSETAREFTTVNHVPGNGGSMSNGGAAVVSGMLFVNSGYSHHGGILPGNVLLAFAVE